MQFDRGLFVSSLALVAPLMDLGGREGGLAVSLWASDPAVKKGIIVYVCP